MNAPDKSTSIRIVTDSTCDLSKDIVKKYDISVIPCYINIGENSYRDGIDISHREFYEKMSGYTQSVKTSAPGVGLFTEVYQNLAREGASQVISMHIHSGLSNLANAARIAANIVKPLEVTVVEMGQLALGLGHIVIKAARAAAQGLSVDKILSSIKNWEENTFIYAALNTIEYLRNSGRVPGLVMMIANLLRIKPIIQLHKGMIQLVGQVRTSAQSLDRLLELMKKLETLEQIDILHTNAEDKAIQFKNIIQRDFHQDMNIRISEATPVLGIHVGPGAVGLACVKK